MKQLPRSSTHATHDDGFTSDSSKSPEENDEKLNKIRESEAGSFVMVNKCNLGITFRQIVIRHESYFITCTLPLGVFIESQIRIQLVNVLPKYVKSTDTVSMWNFKLQNAEPSGTSINKWDDRHEASHNWTSVLRTANEEKWNWFMDSHQHYCKRCPLDFICMTLSREQRTFSWLDFFLEIQMRGCRISSSERFHPSLNLLGWEKCPR